MKCSDQLLRGILEDRLSDPESDVVTGHVNDCPRCQQRLTDLAADGDSWQSAAMALSDGNDFPTRSVVIAIDPELTPEIPLQADPISLDFLDDPSHPEMLGRIGRYEVERLIGAGGMGIVLKAFDTELHRPVAVKVLAPHLAHSGGARQRFAREAQSAAAVIHENVVPIFNVDAAGKLPFLVMQYVAGESVQARVDRDGPLSLDEVLRIGVQTAKGLAAAHDQGLVHRDVKPGNILTEQNVERVLISDFGLARAADDASVTRSGVIAGTPHYMSPEQATGQSIDARCDLFSLGSVLYFLCTGSPPFRAEGAMAVLNRICHERHRPVDDVNDRVPADLADLIDRLLEKDPARRPARAETVAHALTAMIQGTRGRARLRRNRRRWRIPAPTRLALLVTAMAAAIIITGFALWPNARPDGTSRDAEGEPDRSVVTGRDVSGPTRTDDVTPSPESTATRSGDDAAAWIVRSLDALRDADFDVDLRIVDASTRTEELRNQRVAHAERQTVDFWHDELRAVEIHLEVIEAGVHGIAPFESADPSASELRSFIPRLDE